jgi:hypothetical protein
VYLAAVRGLGFAAPTEAPLLYVDAEEVVTVAEEPVDELVASFRAAHRDHDAARAFAPTPGAVCAHCEFRHACLKNGVPIPRELRLF